MSASSVESSVTPVSAHYTDAPKDLDYHSVLANGKVRAMAQAVSSGDCNACHTLHGAQNAPGRIMAP